MEEIAGILPVNHLQNGSCGGRGPNVGNNDSLYLSGVIFINSSQNSYRACSPRKPRYLEFYFQTFNCFSPIILKLGYV
jgi:hypothetical protein